MNKVAGTTSFPKSKNLHAVNGLASETDRWKSLSISMDQPFSVTGMSRTSALEEKLAFSRKIHSNSSKRESVLRQKSFHQEKSYRTYSSKGASKTGKLSGLGALFFDKKLKSISDSASVHFKHCSIKLGKAAGVDLAHEHRSFKFPASSLLSPSAGPLAASSFGLDSVHATSMLPKPDNSSIISVASMIPPADTELTLATNCNASPLPGSYNTSLFQCPMQEKNEMIVKLVPRLQEMQNRLHEWTEWANQKVMQAARRLSKDRAELRTLRQEKEEAEQLRKEKRINMENTMKKLSEMDNALSKADGQVEQANAALRRLGVENITLRKEMEAAKLRDGESAANFQEVSEREKRTLMKFQSWEKQKALFQEELAIESSKLAQLQLELEQSQNTASAGGSMERGREGKR